MDKDENSNLCISYHHIFNNIPVLFQPKFWQDNVVKDCLPHRGIYIQISALPFSKITRLNKIMLCMLTENKWFWDQWSRKESTTTCSNVTILCVWNKVTIRVRVQKKTKKKTKCGMISILNLFVQTILQYMPADTWVQTLTQLQSKTCVYRSTGHTGRRLRCDTSLRWRISKLEHLEQETFCRRDLQLGDLQQQGTSRQRVLLDGEQHWNIWRSDEMDLRALPFAQLNCISSFKERPLCISELLSFLSSFEVC